MKRILLLILFISINYSQLNWATGASNITISFYSNRDHLKANAYSKYDFHLEGHQDVMQKIFYTRMCTNDDRIDANSNYVDSLLIDYYSAWEFTLEPVVMNYITSQIGTLLNPEHFFIFVSDININIHESLKLYVALPEYSSVNYELNNSEFNDSVCDPQFIKDLYIDFGLSNIISYQIEVVSMTDESMSDTQKNAVINLIENILGKIDCEDCISFYKDFQDFEGVLDLREKEIIKEELNSLTLIEYDRDAGFKYNDSQYIQDENSLLDFIDVITHISSKNINKFLDDAYIIETYIENAKFLPCEDCYLAYIEESDREKVRIIKRVASQFKKFKKLWDLNSAYDFSLMMISEVNIKVYVDSNKISAPISKDIKEQISKIIVNRHEELAYCDDCISFELVDFNTLIIDDPYAANTNEIVKNDTYSDSWAVIIGIDKYKYSNQLKYAVKDAQAIKNILIKKFNFPQNNITYLVNEDATMLAIRTALGNVAKNASENDRILIYYSGHGATIKPKRGPEKGYIIPYEGRENDPFATGYSMDEMLMISQLSDSKHMLFLMDACYSGLMTESTKGFPEIKEGYLSKVSKIPGRQIITAGSSDELVIERDEWQHSAFTISLIEGLENWNADINKDGYITANELGNYLREKVTIISDNQQTPTHSRFKNSGNGEFIFFNK